MPKMSIGEEINLNHKSICVIAIKSMICIGVLHLVILVISLQCR